MFTDGREEDDGQNDWWLIQLHSVFSCQVIYSVYWQFPEKKYYWVDTQAAAVNIIVSAPEINAIYSNSVLILQFFWRKKTSIMYQISCTVLMRWDNYNIAQREPPEAQGERCHTVHVSVCLIRCIPGRTARTRRGNCVCTPQCLFKYLNCIVSQMLNNIITHRRL